MTPEGIVLRQVLDYLKARRVLAIRINTGGVMRGGRWTKSPNVTKGVSDILGIYLGAPIAIEVKSAKGKLSLDQEKFLTSWKENGGKICVARSVKDVEFFLAQIEADCDK
jgi:Holliday junction resolvase